MTDETQPLDHRSGPDEDWDGGWEAHRRRQQAAWSSTTPVERLAWLEEAIRFAHRTGALRRPPHDA
jgi:hypothetical protein